MTEENALAFVSTDDLWKELAHRHPDGAVAFCLNPAGSTKDPVIVYASIRHPNQMPFLCGYTTMWFSHQSKDFFAQMKRDEDGKLLEEEDE